MGIAYNSLAGLEWGLRCRFDFLGCLEREKGVMVGVVSFACGAPIIIYCNQVLHVLTSQL